MDTLPENANPLARKHMREQNGKIICAIPSAGRPNFKAPGAKMQYSRKNKTPYELRSADFPLDSRAFSEIRPQNSLKIVGGMTRSESKHNRIAVRSIISWTDLAKIIKPSLYFATLVFAANRQVL